MESQTQSLSTGCVFVTALVKTLEDPFQVSGRDTASSIPNKDLDEFGRFGCGPSLYHHFATLLGELDRVPNEVRHYLNQPSLVCDDCRKVRARSVAQLNTGSFGVWDESSHRRIQEAAARHWLCVELQLPRLDPRQVQQIVNVSGKAIAALEANTEKSALFVGDLSHRPSRTMDT